MPNYGAASSNGFAVLDAQTAGLSSISINSEAEFVAESAAGESTTVTFTVTRSGNLTGAATVNWRIKSSSEEDFVASTNTTDTSTDTNTDTTNNGRAASGRLSGFLNDTVSTDDLTNGSDASGTVSFSADDGDSKTITITLSGDTTYEPDEELVVELSNPTGNAVLQSGKFRASTVIVNDDAPTERLVVNNPAFDLIGLTGLRNDPRYSAIDGKRPLLFGENTENYKNFSVAVLDSGVEGTHDKLKDNFAGYVDFIGSAGNGTTRQLTLLDTNNDGTVSDSEIAAASDKFIDNVGHGTHVAGTVGSSDPELDVAL